MPSMRSMLRCRTRPRWWAMALAMLGLMLAYGTWQLLGRPGDQELIGDVAFYPVGFAAIGAALGAARRCRRQARLRSAWTLLAVGAGLYLAGDVAQTVYELLGSLPYPSIADALYLSFYPVMLWGLLRFPSRTGRAPARLILDLMIVALGGAMVVTYVVLGPTLRQGGAGTLATVVSVAYPVGDVVLMVGLGSALLRPSDASSARALQFMAAGLAWFVAADVTYGWINLHSIYHGGDPVDTLWMLAIALTAVAGSAQTTPTAAGTPDPAESPQASWAPYLATAAGFGLLIVDHRDIEIVVSAVVLACLVAGRQFLAQRELVRHQRLAHHHAQHDALTGLPNRRRLLADLQAALDGASAGSPQALALFDLDGFKSYNDAFGHLAGDQLLVRLAERLDAAVVPYGRAYRLGGDEFCVLLDAGVEHAPRLAAAEHALSETGPGFAVGASSGAVIIPEEASELSAALHIADTRMYAHKGGHRAARSIAQTRDVLLRATAEHTAGLPDHMLQVGELARRVALQLGLDADTVDLTLRAGELHDVGKIAIPESILNKPAALEEDEWRYMRQHTIIGQRVLEAAPALAPVAAIVRSAHERFDGDGYPDGLAGEQIPLPARIVFACDAYHAMTETRPYGPPMSEPRAREELNRCAGTQFDPLVIEALLAVLDREPALAAVAPAVAQ